MGVPYYMVATHDPPKDKIPDDDGCLQVTADDFPSTTHHLMIIAACVSCHERDNREEKSMPLLKRFMSAGNGCTAKVKHEPFTIPVAKFEATLIDALQQIGVNAVPT